MISRYVTAFAIGLLTSPPALAYLDPSTGSMIVQGLIAGVTLTWFTIKNYWYKLNSIFSKKTSDKAHEDGITNKTGEAGD